MDARKRMKELIPILTQAAKAYYQEDREIMSNLEYDKLYDELVKLEEETGITLAGSPTMLVGYEALEELPKEAHETPMLSLDKTKDREALRSFIGSHKTLLSWKLDGLTIVLTYREGKLEKAVTRGNGIIGEVITNNARVFQNIPLQIQHKGTLVLRGEAIITYSDFKNSVEQQFLWLQNQGFDVVEYRAVTAENLDEAMDYFEHQVTRNDFPSDGLVALYDDIAYGASLGSTAKFPRNAFAFKWKDEIRESVLREIEWSPSRTGLINPVAIFDPVELEGTTVSRASVHNISILKELQLGIGDKIQVYKANMIIPQIAENLTRPGNLQIPHICPVCKEEARVLKTNEVEALYCMNPDCQAKKIKSFTLFVSRDAMNIDGLSEATLEKFILKGFIRDFGDIFEIQRYREQIVEMDGFGEKSYENLISSIEKARHTTLPRVIYSLGITNIGLANAKVICREFEYDVESMIHATAEEISAIEGIGPVIAKTFTEYFSEEENLKKFRHLMSHLELEEVKKEEKQSLAGKQFVITGSVEHFANRAQLKEFIEQRGGKVTGSVTSKTNYLINNDTTSNSSKNKKAKELGVPILSEEDFIEMAGV